MDYVHHVVIDNALLFPSFAYDSWGFISRRISFMDSPRGMFVYAWPLTSQPKGSCTNLYRVVKIFITSVLIYDIEDRLLDTRIKIVSRRLCSLVIYYFHVTFICGCDLPLTTSIGTWEKTSRREKLIFGKVKNRTLQTRAKEVTL